MKLRLPIIIINFKTYKESTGKNAVKLAKICEKVAKKTKKSIAIAVSETDICEVTKKVKIPVLAQHVDGEEYGAHTGSILPESIKKLGAVGSLINHSERQIPFDKIEKAVQRCKKNKLITIVCAKDDKLSEKLSKLHPDFIAMEPPELIGGKISVSSSKPELVKKTVKKVKKNKVKTICGAGVHTKEDVKAALKLGTVGVLLASGITKSNFPEKDLLEMCKSI